MMTVYAALAVTFLGIWLVWRGCMHSCGGWKKKSAILTGGVLLILCGAVYAILGLVLQSYDTLSHPGDRQPIATVKVTALYPVAQTFSVSVTRLTGSRRTTACILRGNDWKLLGTRQQWHWWVPVNATHATFSIERIGSPAQHAAKPWESICNTRLPRPKIMTYLPGSLIRAIGAMALAGERPVEQDMAQPLTDRATFCIDITPGGFVTRPCSS